MSTSAGVNVLRWSALGIGIFYGIYHQSSINAQDRARRFKQEYHHKEQLISKAKAEFLKKTLPPEKQTAGGDIITDPNDPKFDLEAYLTMKEAGEK